MGNFHHSSRKLVQKLINDIDKKLKSPDYDDAANANCLGELAMKLRSFLNAGMSATPDCLMDIHVYLFHVIDMLSWGDIEVEDSDKTMGILINYSVTINEYMLKNNYMSPV